MAGVILKSLRMENFGCFRDRKVEFDSGVNQIIGPNESGKSTVIKGLMTAIFEDGTTRKKEISHLRNWSQKTTFKLTLIFQVDNKEFTLIRDHGTGQDRMIDSDGIIYEGKAIREKLAIYFGTHDRTLYESVFCFYSDDPNSLDRQKSKLKSSLETPVFSGFDRTGADAYLEDEIKKIDNPRAHGPRELDLLDEQMQNLLHQKNELERRFEALAKDKTELDSIRTQIKNFESDIDRLEKEYAGGEAYFRLNEKMAALEERLHDHLDAYSKAQQDAEDLSNIEKELSEISVPAEDELKDLEIQRCDLEEAMEASKKTMDSLILHRTRANRDFLSVTFLLVFLCLVYVINETGLYDIGSISELIPYSIPIMTLVWVGGIISYLSYFRKKKKATVQFRQKVSEMDSFYAELNHRCNLMAADPIKAAYELLNNKQSLEFHAANLKGRIDLLTDGEGMEHLAKIGREVETEVAQLNKEFAPLVEFSVAASKLPKIKEELATKRVRNNAYRERAASLKERCSAMESVKNNQEKIENELGALKRKHREITERLEVLKITRMALNRAADRLIEQTFTSYSEVASIYLSELTGEKHGNIRFSEENGKFELKTGEPEIWRPLGDFLSSSTRDAIFLSLHAAAMNKVSQEFAPPVIFDLPDAHMDNERKKYFRGLITRLASERQAIYASIEAVQFDGALHIIKAEPEMPEKVLKA